HFSRRAECMRRVAAAARFLRILHTHLKPQRASLTGDSPRLRFGFHVKKNDSAIAMPMATTRRRTSVRDTRRASAAPKYPPTTCPTDITAAAGQSIVPRATNQTEATRLIQKPKRLRRAI